MSDYLTSIADRFDVYLAFHSYSQLLMFPYGHSSENVSNYDELVGLHNDNFDNIMNDKVSTQPQHSICNKLSIETAHN
jgi:hypothetical protein